MTTNTTRVSVYWTRSEDLNSTSKVFEAAQSYGYDQTVVSTAEIGSDLILSIVDVETDWRDEMLAQFDADERVDSYRVNAPITAAGATP